ncbi:hypothetical protein [Mumia zhuanghuii]|nr:hypothetical protein [Mumia zhuanghuii]
MLAGGADEGGLAGCFKADGSGGSLLRFGPEGTYQYNRGQKEPHPERQ